MQEYVKTRRGKELPGFVNYRTFENIVKKHIEELQEPALKLLKDVTGEEQCLMVYRHLDLSLTFFYLTTTEQDNSRLFEKGYT